MSLPSRGNVRGGSDAMWRSASGKFTHGQGAPLLGQGGTHRNGYEYTDGGTYEVCQNESNSYIGGFLDSASSMLSYTLNSAVKDEYMGDLEWLEAPPTPPAGVYTLPRFAPKRKVTMALRKPAWRQQVQRWLARADLQQLLVLAIGFVMAYILLSVFVSMLGLSSSSVAEPKPDFGAPFHVPHTGTAGKHRPGQMPGQIGAANTGWEDGAAVLPSNSRRASAEGPTNSGIIATEGTPSRHFASDSIDASGGSGPGRPGSGSKGGAGHGVAGYTRTGASDAVDDEDDEGDSVLGGGLLQDNFLSDVGTRGVIPDQVLDERSAAESDASLRSRSSSPRRSQRQLGKQGSLDLDRAFEEADGDDAEDKPFVVEPLHAEYPLDRRGGRGASRGSSRGRSSPRAQYNTYPDDDDDEYRAGQQKRKSKSQGGSQRYSRSFDDEEDDESDRPRVREGDRARHLRSPAGQLRFDGDGVAVGFSWQEYLSMYPGLSDRNVVDESSARRHYARYGRKEGRFPRIPPLYLQYTACRTVYEQYYSHLAAWALAYRVRAEIVLAPALIKDGQGSWVPAPTDTLLNVTAMQTAATQLDMAVHRCEEYSAMPSLDAEMGVPGDQAFPEYVYNEVHHRHVVKLTQLYQATRGLDELASYVLQEVGSLGPRLVQSGDWSGSSQFPVLVNLPCTYFAVESTTALPELQRMTHLLYFPSSIISLAEEAVTSLYALLGALPGARLSGAHTRKGRHRFNGIVVYSYEDYMTYTTSLQPTAWHKYKKALEVEIANTSLPCYVGFEELQTVDAGWDVMQKRVVDTAGACTALFHQGHVLPSHRRHTLADQQQLLLDFMVLYKAQTVVGNHMSLMLLFLNEFRHVHGAKGRVVRVQTKLEPSRPIDEIDWLSHGALFTTRHSHGIQDRPKLYMGNRGARPTPPSRYDPFDNL